MSKEKQVTAINSSILTILFIVFLVLKLTGEIDWSWWWVTSPLWLPVAILLVVVNVILIVGAIMLWGRKIKQEEQVCDRENRQGEQVYRNQNINMKTAITYSVFFITILITTVGLVTTINEYPNFAVVIAFILTCVLIIMGIKKFLDDTRIKQGKQVDGMGRENKCIWQGD